MGKVIRAFIVDDPERMGLSSRLNDRIKYYFGLTGYDVEDIARLLGISVQAVYNICSGQTRPRIDRLVQIYKLIKTKIQDISFQFLVSGNSESA